MTTHYFSCACSLYIRAVYCSGSSVSGRCFTVAIVENCTWSSPSSIDAVVGSRNVGGRETPSGFIGIDLARVQSEMPIFMFSSTDYLRCIEIWVHFVLVGANVWLVDSLCFRCDSRLCLPYRFVVCSLDISIYFMCCRTSRQNYFSFGSEDGTILLAYGCSALTPNSLTGFRLIPSRSEWDYLWYSHEPRGVGLFTVHVGFSCQPTFLVFFVV